MYTRTIKFDEHILQFTCLQEAQSFFLNVCENEDDCKKKKKKTRALKSGDINQHAQHIPVFRKQVVLKTKKNLKAVTRTNSLQC